MATEIERKFLVVGNAWRTTPAIVIWQGYLNRDPQRTVRLRVADEQGFLTIKGAAQGITRAEFEYPIALADATAMRALCDGPIIEKLRRRVWHDGLCWEVDEFLGDNMGLVVAEIELQTEQQAFTQPPWLGREVSHEPRYFNSRLASQPFCHWPDRAELTLADQAATPPALTGPLA